MSTLVIRPASITDISSIVEIRLVAFTDEEVDGFIVPQKSVYTSVERLRNMWNKDNLLKDGCEVFVAENETKVVGFIVYNMKSFDDNIDNIIVAKKEQGKGVGRALFDYVEALAKTRGVNFMSTDTTENAEGFPWKSYSFWRKMGYEDHGERVATEYGFKVIPLVKELN